MASVAPFFAPYSFAAGNNLLIAGAMLLCLSACGGQPDDKATRKPAKAKNRAINDQPRNYLISGDSVGNIKIGSKVTAVYDLFVNDRLRKETYRKEGMPYQALEIYHDTASSPSLVLALNCESRPCAVRKITIHDSSYHTAAGIRIGSTFGEIKKAQKTGYIGWGEGTFVVVSADMPLTYSMDISKIGEPYRAKLSTATLPDSIRVKSMFMFKPVPAEADSLQQRLE